jgi:phosphotransferase system HPr-like phosphotransfer protein
MLKSVLHVFGLYQDAKAQIAITDPHGLHMRRCKDLVLVARKHVAYRVFVRNVTVPGKTWVNARSILGLQTLGVRGHRNREPLPIVEVKVSGFRPRPVLQEIRRVLEEDPNKYLSVYELAELAKETGGRIIARMPERRTARFRQRLRALFGQARRKGEFGT